MYASGYPIQHLQLGLLAVRGHGCRGTPPLSCALNNRPAGSGSRNRRHLQVAGASMGAGEEELGFVKARGCGPQ